MQTVLEEIEADKKPCILVYNKVDLCEQAQARVETNAQGSVTQVHVSAATGAGLDALRQIIRDYFYADMVDRELLLPPHAGRLRAQLYEQHAVLEETVEDNGELRLQVRMPWRRLSELCLAAGLSAPAPPEIDPDASALLA